jgi:alpha-D-ribose 1-methylphosphonate 5-triphosphate synthase subunit PhnH
MPLLDDFKIGDEEHPESAATLIIQVEEFNDTNGQILRVPGIKSTTPFAPKGIPVNFWEQWQLQAALLPVRGTPFYKRWTASRINRHAVFYPWDDQWSNQHG